MRDENKPPSGFVKIYSAQQELDAQMIKALLEDEGISVALKDAPLWLSLCGACWPANPCGMELFVPAEQEERARAILEGERGPDWVCPECKEKIDGVFDACWKCGRERESITP